MHKEKIMAKFSVIIAESSNVKIDSINQCVKQDNDFEVAVVTHNANEVIDLCNNTQADLLLVNHSLFETQDLPILISLIPIHTKIAFLSDDASFAIEAFDLGAVDFLLPPFTEQRINKLFDKFKKLHQNQSAYPFKQIQALLNKSHEPQNNNESIIVKDSGRIRIIDADEIIWIGGAGNYVEIHLAQEARPILHRETLSTMLEKMASHGFIRIHRSTLVKKRSIKEVQPTESGDYLLTLKNGANLNLSRRYKQNMAEILN
ncbi:DNA-binding response regulator [Pseudoalteromonas tunicata]|nr:DNA-binding response regulator [Pseudoalteromonas tunicata]